MSRRGGYALGMASASARLQAQWEARQPSIRSACESWRHAVVPSPSADRYSYRTNHGLRAVISSPEAWGDGDGRDMAVPALTLAFRLAEDVAHDLAPRALRRDAVLGPFRQVLQVERQVILRSTMPTSERADAANMF